MMFYDFKVLNNLGEEVSLKEYAGKVVLVVNTATGCGFTPQYKGLQELFDKYEKNGFVILDFPCNQFGHQAPGNDTEIHEFCTLIYNTSFPRFKKIDVNGKDQAPLYKYLKEQQKGILGSNIKWNFTKFLINREGEVVGRFAPTVKPQELEEKIKALL